MNKEYVNTGRTNQKLETRNKILASAQYFLNKGLVFNLEDIANKTGISRATIYRYFSNIDILAAEAALDVSTQSPETLYDNSKGKGIEDQILEIQDYYNTLTINHENLFRKYLSAILDSSSSSPKRGARRKKTLKLVLEDTDLTNREKEDLSNLLSIYMGMEPLIITKDVCGLNNKESMELMKWGMKLLLKGLRLSKK
ncbi:TetR/AcrR family transcriptional regulator [Eudoraea chungangensis]|uniref:TetR/AcrR family transcriptional regulator n=1 Tax=Eudoraea chungangensis TaxID=1481905 RepID=UPI0023ED35E0|nr:TetR/AcrR family transcriptional regulator [Eudoraea chungangensis]